MTMDKYLESYRLSKDVNEFYTLIRKSGNKGKEATIKRYFYKIRATFRSPNEPYEQARKQLPNDKILNEPPEVVEEYDFGEYTSSHLKKLKMADFKRYNVKLTDAFLTKEGFTFEEINKILGRHEDVKKFETDDEVVFA